MSQLSLPIQEFYQALSDGDRQYAQEQAQEIKLIAHNASIQIGLKLIKVKERLGHGKFGDWIKLEFDWSDRQARRLMTIASELGNRTDQSILPTGTNPAYALASAMSKEDEEGKQEILDSYQEALEQKQKEAIEKAEETGKDPKIPNALTEAQIKELIAKRDELEKQLEEEQGKTQSLSKTVESQKATITLQTQSIEQVNNQLKLKVEQLIQLDKQRVDDANKLAEAMVTAKEAEFQKEKTRLEQEKTKAEEQLESEKERLKKFKENPDSETAAKITQLRNELTHLEYELDRLKDTEDQTKKAGIVINNFYDGFLKLLKDHPEALVYAASSYLTDAHTVKATALADHMEEFSHQLRQSLDKSKGNHFLNEIEVDASAIDVEVVNQFEDDF